MGTILTSVLRVACEFDFFFAHECLGGDLGRNHDFLSESISGKWHDCRVEYSFPWNMIYQEKTTSYALILYVSVGFWRILDRKILETHVFWSMFLPHWIPQGFFCMTRHPMPFPSVPQSTHLRRTTLSGLVVRDGGVDSGIETDRILYEITCCDIFSYQEMDYKKKVEAKLVKHLKIGRLRPCSFAWMALVSPSWSLDPHVFPGNHSQIRWHHRLCVTGCVIKL